MITTIILSKDRPAQLDLLLRSIERNGGGQFEGTIVTPLINEAYKTVFIDHDRWDFSCGDFEVAVRAELHKAGEFVCFMCDDGILYQPLPEEPTWGWRMRTADEVLCVSLRLGQNTWECYPSNHVNAKPSAFTGKINESLVWRWTLEPRFPGESDFGYPGSIDGHIFRTADVRRMLDGKSFPNPTALECALYDGCNELSDERPFMACYPHSVYVGNPINRVSEQSGVRYGESYPVTADECNQRFLAGERIDLEALDFSHVNGAHTEIELKWH